ncbi:hypothetical protein V7127_19740 [Bacillus sp. JJ1773]|uniref:hypothetical protein n=1 Tax=Bacillus sp. JJ1773 TaxID=3122965 RepID=UPI002FFE96B8
MVRRTCLLFCLLSMVTLPIGCSKQESQVSKELNENKTTNNLSIPNEYSHAKDIIVALTKQGLKINEIKNSNSMALFQTKPNYAMYVESEWGDFELIHLENKNGKDFIIIKKEETDGGYVYSIRKNDEPEQLYYTNAITYFNKNDEYITISRTKELNEIIRKVFEISQK